jgi:hypothetical protein
VGRASFVGEPFEAPVSWRSHASPGICVRRGATCGARHSRAAQVRPLRSAAFQAAFKTGASWMRHYNTPLKCGLKAALPAAGRVSPPAIPGTGGPRAADHIQGGCLCPPFAFRARHPSPAPPTSSSPYFSSCMHMHAAHFSRAGLQEGYCRSATRQPSGRCRLVHITL